MENAGKERWKKRTPTLQWGRIGIETLSHAKAGRLPSGLSLRENLQNF